MGERASSAPDGGTESLISCRCGECEETPHSSHCSVHNMPAYPNGECDCRSTHLDRFGEQEREAREARSLRARISREWSHRHDDTENWWAVREMLEELRELEDMRSQRPWERLT